MHPDTFMYGGTSTVRMNVYIEKDTAYFFQAHFEALI